MIIVLPYRGSISSELKVKLHRTFKQLPPAYDLRIIFKISSQMKNCFNFKDKINQQLRFLFATYNFKCNSFNEIETEIEVEIEIANDIEIPAQNTQLRQF